MSNVTTYFEQAQLALAAYSNLAPGMTRDDYELALRDDGKAMTPTQAAAFAAKWSVVAQYNDAATSLSATVFQEIATGKHYLAIRGTDPTDIGDLLADGGILLHGIPDLSDQYQSLHAKVVEWQTNGVLPGAFTVAGHSLGGWLAEGLAVDFAASIEHTYVYNSPGLFGAGFGDLMQQINDALGTSFLSVPTLANLTNIRASDGLSLIAGLGQPLSPPIGILIEDQTQPDIGDPAASRNHSQRALVDSLSLYALFAKIDPGASVDAITKIIESASAKNGDTLERTLDALRTLFQQNYQYGHLYYDATPTLSGDTPTGRDDYYSNLQSLQTWWDASPFTALTLTPLAELSAGQIATLPCPTPRTAWPTATPSTNSTPSPSPAAAPSMAASTPTAN